MPYVLAADFCGFQLVLWVEPLPFGYEREDPVGPEEPELDAPPLILKLEPEPVLWVLLSPLVAIIEGTPCEKLFAGGGGPPPAGAWVGVGLGAGAVGAPPGPGGGAPPPGGPGVAGCPGGFAAPGCGG